MEAAIEFEAVQEAVSLRHPLPTSATQPTSPTGYFRPQRTHQSARRLGHSALMINQNAMTLEDLVKDLMRPMLKSGSTITCLHLLNVLCAPKSSESRAAQGLDPARAGLPGCETQGPAALSSVDYGRILRFLAC